MRYRAIIYTILSVGLVLFSHSCTLNIPYENQFSDPDAIKTVTNARELLASAYSSLPHQEFDLSVLSDDFQETHLISKNSSLRNQHNWHPESIRDMATQLWENYYSTISTINALLGRIDHIELVTEADGEELKEVISEAYLLKALCYYKLLQLFAPTYTDGKEKDGIILKEELELQYLERTDIEGSVAAIREMLEEAIEIEFEYDENYLLSQLAGYYQLAELELYAGNYKKAREHAQKVIDSKSIELLGAAEYKRLWSSDASQERLFASHITTTFYKEIQIGKDGDIDPGDYLSVNDVLAETYSDDDIRGGEGLDPFDMPGETIGTVVHVNNLGKYNRMNRENEEIEYVNKLRLSGAYFIMAEAHCLDPQGSDLEAINVMNQYLEKREAEPIDGGLSGDELLKTILLEKWKEFVGEGVRYFDLKRYRKSVLSDWCVVGGGDREIDSKDYRWTFPLPPSEYLHNDNVKQNEGWTIIKE